MDILDIVVLLAYGLGCSLLVISGLIFKQHTLEKRIKELEKNQKQ